MPVVTAEAAVSGALQKSWGWLMGWGVLLIIVGFIGLSYEFLATAVAVDVIGLFLITLGVIELVQAFRHQRVADFFLYLLGGVASIVAGVALFMRPLAGMAVLTLLMASYFLVVGSFRLVGSIVHRNPGWGWGAFSGATGVLLGILIWSEWPLSSVWAIGLFVAISLIFQGWNYVMLALVAKRGAAILAKA